MSGVPWVPDDLPFEPGDDPARWHYVVLEEMVDGVALLMRWTWPTVDPLGHLRWTGTADAGSVTTPAGLLRAQLYAPNGIERDPRIGDVFAVRGGSDRWRGPMADVRTLLGDAEVYDVSASARGAAKLAYLSSLGAVQQADQIGAPVTRQATGRPPGRTTTFAPPPQPPQLPRLQVAPPPDTPPSTGSQPAGGR